MDVKAKVLLQLLTIASRWRMC